MGMTCPSQIAGSHAGVAEKCMQLKAQLNQIRQEHLITRLEQSVYALQLANTNLPPVAHRAAYYPPRLTPPEFFRVGYYPHE